MIDAILQQQAAKRAAEQLRDLLLRLGANDEDISIVSDNRSTEVRGRGSAGAASEFGDQHRPALRRLGRAIESMRRGESL